AKPAPARPAAKSRSAGSAPAMPANGQELQRRLGDYDARLAQQGVCKAGELVQYIIQAGVKAGDSENLATWTPPALALAGGGGRRGAELRGEPPAEKGRAQGSRLSRPRRCAGAAPSRRTSMPAVPLRADSTRLRVVEPQHGPIQGGEHDRPSPRHHLDHFIRT